MPQLGLAMESGRIVAWLKQTGELVKAGEVLLEVETDKATIEVEAVESGRLQIVLPAAEADVVVGATIGFILGEGEAAVAPRAEETLAVPATTGGSAPEPQRGVAPLASPAQLRRAASTPAARRRAAESNVDWRQAVPTGARGQIRERDVVLLAATQRSAPAPVAGVEPPAVGDDRITPVARRLAEALGVDLSLVTGFYPNQRITRDEVEATVRRLLQARSDAVPPPAAEPTRVPLTPVRRLIGERMAASAHTVAPVTLTTEVDATELVRLRETLRSAGTDAALVPSYNVILAKVAATALREQPQLNSTLEADAIVQWPEVHVGIAVDTERGLVVPVLRAVERKSLATLAVEGDDLLGRARAGKARPEELTGGTFTITNLGAYRIDAFTPIINPPQCAILGVGRIKRQLVVNDDDSTRICSMLVLSLTFDHRVVDGAPAARFLDRIRQLIEQPYLWLAK